MGAVVKVARTKVGTAAQRIEPSPPEPMSFGNALSNWASPTQGTRAVTALDSEPAGDSARLPFLTSRLLKGILQASATTRCETLAMAARQIGVSYNHLMLVVDNRRTSSEELRARIAAYCGISADLIRPAPLRSTDPAESGMAKLEVPTNAGNAAVVFIPKAVTDDDVREVIAAVARWAIDAAARRAEAQEILQQMKEDHDEHSAE
jgi:hypothetical protein